MRARPSSVTRTTTPASPPTNKTKTSMGGSTPKAKTSWCPMTHLAVTDSGFGNSQVAWAPAGDISAANAILEGQGSTARLKAGASDLSGQAPDGKGGDKSLQRVEVEMGNGDKDVTLTDDCGTAAHEVTGAHTNMIFAAQIGDGQDGTTHTDPHRYVGGAVAPQQPAPVAYFDEVMKREWPQMSRVTSTM